MNYFLCGNHQNNLPYSFLPVFILVNSSISIKFVFLIFLLNSQPSILTRVSQIYFNPYPNDALIQHTIQKSNNKFSEASQKNDQIYSQQIILYAENGVTKSENHANIVDTSTLTWGQTIKLPSLYNYDFQFEIYSISDLSNPQEPQVLLYGTMRVSSNQDCGIWEVYNSESRNSKVGQLYVDFGKIVKQNKSMIVQFQKVLCSIKITLVLSSLEKGYITIHKSGRKVLQSQVLVGQKGEFNYFLTTGEKNLVKCSNNNQTLLVEFITIENQVLCKANFSFKSQAKMQKQFLFNNNAKKVGDIYFEIAKQKIYEPQKGVRKLNQSYSSMRISKMRSHSEANLMKLRQSQFISKPRHKRISIMHNNNDIVIPSERRFQLYQDKQSQIISYSRLSSMKFEKHYKGASIGNGSKTDFSEQYRSNPGVGQYKLPSIFDRY